MSSKREPILMGWEGVTEHTQAEEVHADPVQGA